MAFDPWSMMSGLAGPVVSGLGILAGMRSNDKTNSTNLNIQRETNAANERMATAANTVNYQIAQETNATNADIARQNLGFQRENLDYQKDLQQQIFAREDNAYQRTVADMKAAGISPLAMSGTNGAGDVVNTEAQNNGYQAQVGNPMQAAQFEAAQMQAYDPSSATSQLGSGLINMASNLMELKRRDTENDIKQQEANTRKLDVISKITKANADIREQLRESGRRDAMNQSAISLNESRKLYTDMLKQYQSQMNTYYEENPSNFSKDRLADAVTTLASTLLGAKENTPGGVVKAIIPKAKEAFEAVLGNGDSTNPEGEQPAYKYTTRDGAIQYALDQSNSSEGAEATLKSTAYWKNASNEERSDALTALRSFSKRNY